MAEKLHPVHPEHPEHPPHPLTRKNGLPSVHSAVKNGAIDNPTVAVHLRMVANALDANQAAIVAGGETETAGDGEELARIQTALSALPPGHVLVWAVCNDSP